MMMKLHKKEKLEELKAKYSKEIAAFFSPRSSCPIYIGWSDGLYANSSWLKPCSYINVANGLVEVKTPDKDRKGIRSWY